MAEALRNEEGLQTYTDFIESLEEIQQMCPLQPEHTGAKARNQLNPPPVHLAELAKRERSASLQKNERSAHRYPTKNFHLSISRAVAPSPPPPMNTVFGLP